MTAVRQSPSGRFVEVGGADASIVQLVGVTGNVASSGAGSIVFFDAVWDGILLLSPTQVWASWGASIEEPPLPTLAILDAYLTGGDVQDNVRIRFYAAAEIASASCTINLAALLADA